MKAVLPEFWKERGAVHPAGVYLGPSDADYIVLRADVSLNDKAYEPYEPVYHEYVHYLTRHMISRLPLWMVEGLAEFYGNMQIQSKKDKGGEPLVELGAPSATRLFALHEQKKLLPVAALFEIDASSPYYHEHNKASIFYAESWALTHYLYTRDWNEKTHRVNDFMNLLEEKGVDPKDAAKQTVGEVSTLDDPLRQYVRNQSFGVRKMRAPNIDENGFRVRDITDAEALAVRADIMAHDRHYSEAQQMLEEALKADPKLGIACDGLSFLSLQQGKTDEAEKYAAQALALDPQDYRANYYYAWSLLKSGHTDNESLTKAEASLRAVIKGNPEFVPAYDAMAYVLTLQGEKEKLDEAYMMTLQATSREPGNVHYRIRAVEVLERQQRADDAVRVATRAVSMAKTPEEQQAAAAALDKAQQFQETWKKYKAMEASQASSGKVNAPEAPRSVLNIMRQVNVAAGVVILSNTQGVDFNSYLSGEVISKIQRQWGTQIQKVSAEAASKSGKVVFEFAIEKNGSLGNIQMKQSTQNDELDGAVRGAIQSASPFAPLPAKFRGKNLLLQFQCEYKQGSTADAADQGKASDDKAASDGKKEDKENQ